MKPILNNDYIKYKMFFITSAYYQDISKETAGLFITTNDLFYFPEFIIHQVVDNYLDRAAIHLKRINHIVCKVVQLTLDKCNEIDS